MGLLWVLLTLASATSVYVGGAPGRAAHVGASFGAREATGLSWRGGAMAAAASSALSPDANPRSKARRPNLREFADANFFVLGMLISVVAAKAFPGVCVDGGPLKPEFVVGQLGVAAVFLLSGLSIKLNELKTAVLNVKFNAVVQGTSLLAIPLASAAGVALLRQTTPIHPKLLDGLLATACLPTTVNMCVILTTSAGGNVAASLANAVMGNFLGIFVTPALLLGLLAATADVPLLAIVRKLFAKVVLPVVAGQLLRSWKPLLELQQRRSGAFKRMSEIVLLLIVWNAFSNSFTAGLAIPLRDLAILGAFVPALHLGTLLGLKSFYSKFFDPRDAVAGAFVASHKTLAFGLPLLKLVFAGSPDLGYLCAPLLLLHPSQLLVGSLLVPRFQKSIAASSKERNDSGAHSAV